MEFNRSNKYFRIGKQFSIAVTVVLLAYFSTCLFLFLQQRYLIYRPSSKLSMLPNAKAFNFPYQDIWIPIASSQARLHGWWIPASSKQEKYSLLHNEPILFKGNSTICQTKNVKS